ncbi:hypothetical protein E3P94_02941 [Wallemia ichthyophaga]|nr:hypothetical protein E3P95_02940 [Wallemia ichthyophaga]TIA98413.1 hypothetical protein E3P94_02941 [Wallemia ichthyophaga]
MVDTQPASLHSLPAELLDMVLILQPQLAKTCKYLYNLNLKNYFAIVRGPGCKIRGVSHYTFSETPVKLIGGFNGRLKRMTILPCADYVRKLYVNMHNTKSGKMGSYINTLANHVCAFTNLHQLTVTLSSLYHILAMKNIVMENISTLVLECRSFYLEDSEPDDVVDLLLTSFPNLEKVLLYAGNDFRGSAEKLKKVCSDYQALGDLTVTSFNDLESGGVPLSTPNESPGVSSGLSGYTKHSSQLTPTTDEFIQLKDKLSISIFKINGNIQGINRIVAVLGTAKEQGDSRDRLHELLESTRLIVKNTTENVRNFTNWDYGAHPANSPQIIRNTQSKISRDFSGALQSFQRMQKDAAERTKLSTEKELSRRVEGAAQPAQPDEVLYNHQDIYQGELQEEQQQQQEQHQQQIHPRRITEAEMAYQDGLIEERDHEIRDIETGIHELNDIFRDLGGIVVEQGGMLDNIESNVDNISSDANRANDQLISAHEYQRKAGKRALCLLLILTIIKHNANEFLEPTSPTISPALIYFIQNSSPSNHDESPQSQKVARSTPTVSSPKFESTTAELNKRPLSTMFNNVGSASGSTSSHAHAHTHTHIQTQTHTLEEDFRSDMRSNRSSTGTLGTITRNSLRRRTKPSLQLFNSPTSSHQPQEHQSPYTPTLKPSSTHHRNLSTEYLSHKIQGWMPNFTNSLSTPQISTESSSYDNNHKESKDSKDNSKRGMLGKAFSSLHFNDLGKSSPQNSILNYRLRIGYPNQRLVFGACLWQSTYTTKIDKSPSLWKIPIEAKEYLPCLVIRCFEYLIQWAMVEEGIFRISGKSSQILQLRNEFDSGSDIYLRDIHPSILDPHAVASIFKAYLRELPHNILTNENIPQFNDFMQISYKVNAVTSDDTPAAALKCNYKQCDQIDSSDVDLKLLKDILSELPHSNYWLLRLTMKILKLTADNSEVNKMTLSNLVLVICPSVCLSAIFVKILVKHFDYLFGIDHVFEDSEDDELSYLRPETSQLVSSSGERRKFKLLSSKRDKK